MRIGRAHSLTSASLRATPPTRSRLRFVAKAGARTAFGRVPELL